MEHVPAAWDETRVIDGEIARYASIARRSGEEWYVGTATDASPRVVEIPLEFLDADREYVAHVYRDAPETDLEDNPTAIEIERRTVTAADTIEAGMAGGGGHAVRLVPRDDRDGEPAGPPEERPPAAADS
jgi:alpha-glucosidase